ncbi:MAG: RluA family pseudouridine synthase [Patescibacteria group bacterium]
MEIKIKEKNIGQRLDVFLSEIYRKASRSQWQKRIKSGEVLVNEINKSAHYKLRKGDAISINNKQLTRNKEGSKMNTSKQDNNSTFGRVEIIFEDESYLVVNKPAGMVVHADDKHKNGTLVDWLIDKYPEIKKIGDDSSRPGIVHRLDKEVSGLMVVARTQEMFESLKKQFKERKIKKEYIALVHNVMKQDEGEIKLPIKRSKKKGIFIAVSDFLSVFSKTKPALTKYEVLEKFINYTLVKINILTGRTHQIRVHMRSIGHPVVGDKVYTTHDIKKKGKIVDLGRVWLYASKLGFRDLRGEWKEFKIEMPSELNVFLDKVK